MNAPNIPRPGDLIQRHHLQEGNDLVKEEFQVRPEAYWSDATVIGGGYDVIQEVDQYGWTPIPLWGRDGWDLGSWPLVIVFWRITEEEGDPSTRTFEAAEYVEGDMTVWQLPDRQALLDITARRAFAHWKFNEDECEWVRPYTTFSELPDAFKQAPAYPSCQ